MQLYSAILLLDGEVVNFGGDGVVVHEYDGVFVGKECIASSVGLLFGCM